MVSRSRIRGEKAGSKRIGNIVKLVSRWRQKVQETRRERVPASMNCNELKLRPPNEVQTDGIESRQPERTSIEWCRMKERMFIYSNLLIFVIAWFCIVTSAANIKQHQTVSRKRRFLLLSLAYSCGEWLVQERSQYMFDQCSNWNVTWSLHTKQDIEKVEKVQRRFTKRLRRFANLSYSERLHKLELCSLELWRLYFDV